MEGTIKQTKEFSKEIILLRGYSILMRDEHGQVQYTFNTKKKADEFFNALKKQSNKGKAKKKKPLKVPFLTRQSAI